MNSKKAAKEIISFVNTEIATGSAAGAVHEAIDALLEVYVADGSIRASQMDEVRTELWKAGVL